MSRLATFAVGAVTTLTTVFALTPTPAGAAVQCDRTVVANVVALDQPLVFNRLGAQNVNGMTYALRRDVIDVGSKLPLTRGGAAVPGRVALRPDKRPRPIVLRVAAGECLQINLENLLAPVANPNNPPHVALAANDQIAGRMVGFRPQGMQLVNSIADDASFVGKNPSSLVAPGGRATYTLFAEKEGAYLVTNPGGTFGGEGSQGMSSTGLFGAVNVEPKGARTFRSQVTDEELRLATVGKTAAGQPILDYEARYPATEIDPATGTARDTIWTREGKGGLPVLAMVDPATNELVHSDINAIVAGSNPDGSFPPETYPLEKIGKRNPSVPNRLEAFREYTVIFHDESATAQAFPGFFNDPVFRYTIHGVRDSFMINYGSGGIGSEIIANRLGVGAQHDCLNCAYEEFFLASSAVGDPAMVVDIPANVGLETLAPGQVPTPGSTGPKATRAFYPDDPSNVHHGYTNDFVKFRNLHVGKEHHVFHLHNHQWLYNPNDDDSNYLDAQGLGPGSGYTYEINFGGAGNRNKTSGDAIFHCHFYPHFAQGMWEHWRNHDVLETGTPLAVSGGAFHSSPFDLKDGTPAAGARALPDGEIVAGTPIPAIVPLPGKAIPPLPGKVELVANPNTTLASDFHPSSPGQVVPVGSNAKVVDRAVNPGFPFWIAGVEHTVGQRPPTPPLDMLSEAEAQQLGDGTHPRLGSDPLFAGRTAELVAGAGGHDGGLPRHTLDGVAAGGTAIATQTRLDFSKIMTAAKPVFFPEEGTDVERVAMAYHAQRKHPSTKVLLAKGVDGKPQAQAADFVTNGAPPMPSAPYHEPCVDDAGGRVYAGSTPKFFDGLGGLSVTGNVQYGAANPRVYKGANIQIDAVFNKVGWHYPQERIIALWDDVMPTINKVKPPEPFVIRFNTFDCGKYLHTNLVPEFFELDDYQIRTPTDIIGQHIHLPKWDVSSADGSANGWNYEDGTLSPGTVRERIEAINHWNAAAGPNAVATLTGETVLHPKPHPFFGEGPGGHWLGARTTIQRWFFDPVVNTKGVDRGLGIIFTHDHYGPSTHQQIGLYASVLTEPAGSTWVHNETGVALNTRHDGGPTTWQAIIKTGDLDGDGTNDTHREFWYQASDFQHAYLPGVYVGAGPDGFPNGVQPDANSFRSTINPGAREQANPILPDLVKYAPICPGGVARPCPEAISAADPGMIVVNYRNEPIGLRVFDPNKPGPDGKPGAQADGLAGDLAYALQSRSDRKVMDLNSPLGSTPYPPLTNDVGNGDPFTPIMRAVAGDKIKVKIQMGGHEEEHATVIHGLKWLQGGSGFGAAKNSGWRNAQAAGISEQFTLDTPLTPFINSPRSSADYLYKANPSQDGMWSGAWGVIRTYDANRQDLQPLPNNPGKAISNAREFSVTNAGLCPTSAPVRRYSVAAVLANELLPNVAGVSVIPADDSATLHVGKGPLDPNGGTLVYNPRTTALTNGKAGPLHDPTAMVYVYESDLEAKNPSDPACFKPDAKTGVPKFDINQPGCKVKLKAGVPVEPLVLRAAAGECVEVTLRNRLPADLDANGFFDDNPDLANYTPLIAIVHRDNQGVDGVSTFNNNLIRPSSHVGLHTQLAAFDVSKADGTNVGRNNAQTVSPTGTTTYRWYMGDLRRVGDRLVATPVELGGSSLQPADVIKQGQKGLMGGFVVEPAGSAWTADANRRSAASVGPDANRDGKPDSIAFRDFSVVIAKSMSHRYADGSPVENIGADEIGNVITEDTQDAGQSMVNYGSEPLWFRFGLAPNSPLGNTPGGFGAVANVHLAHSNQLTGGADPVTPVFTANPGQPFRMHVSEPHGAFRGTVFNVAGHVWQRDPYVCPGSADLGMPGKCGATDIVGSRAIGTNPLGFAQGGQDGFHAGQHFDLVLPSAGGANAVPGDYLFRDMAAFGNTQGLWGIVRVSPQLAP